MLECCSCATHSTLDATPLSLGAGPARSDRSASQPRLPPRGATNRRFVTDTGARTSWRGAGYETSRPGAIDPHAGRRSTLLGINRSGTSTLVADVGVGGLDLEGRVARAGPPRIGVASRWRSARRARGAARCARSAHLGSRARNEGAATGDRLDRRVRVASSRLWRGLGIAYASAPGRRCCSARCMAQVGRIFTYDGAPLVMHSWG